MIEVYVTCRTEGDDVLLAIDKIPREETLFGELEGFLFLVSDAITPVYQRRMNLRSVDFWL